MTGDSEHEEARWVCRAQERDREAFARLYERTHRAIYGLLWNAVRREEEARDLTQDTYLEAWRALPELRDPGAFRSWLFRIATNKSRDHLKRRRLPTRSLEELGPADESEWGPPDPGPGPAEQLVSGERRERVREAVAELSDDHQEVVRLYYVAGLDVRQIGQALDLPKGTVLSRLARARESLRKRLAPYLEAVDEM